ncbi:VOC family protein [Deinococcus roseus]|uniref:Catechol 2,3-dioxygenase n=1 Tax=Deinococcus roseus TaxID=392414 RepID=A0ABQ2DKJ9_9DEIO|nr:VOC family protein [Deinococcus roseus]GGJ58469.1 catechol 2,3-dioxygenase [Deinococcus roseus]
MPSRYLAHLAHTELLTPHLQQSIQFFQDVMGMTLTHQEGNSAYLRCWGDPYLYSLILTEGDKPALGHAAWRTNGELELLEAVQRLEEAGHTGQWVEKSHGHGRSYRFQSPGGHQLEIFWEVEHYTAPDHLKSTYPERPQRFTGAGTAGRQLDHITFATRDVIKDAHFYRDVLDFRFMCYNGMEDNPDQVVFGMVTTNEKAHDLALGIDFSGIPGRLHHLAFWLDSREDLLRAADILIENGVHIEYGPGKHGMGEQNYLYFREPGGVRIELNTGGVRNYVPDWKTVVWKPSQGSNSMYRNQGMPNSMLEAFPPANAPAAAEIDLPAPVNPWVKHG